MSSSARAAPAPSRPLWRIATRVLRRAIVSFVEDRCTHMAAAISYFALFALFPLTLLAISAFGIVLRDASVQDDVLGTIVDALPVEETSIEDSLRAVADLGPTLTVVSLFAAVWTVGTLAGVVNGSINVVFDVDRPRPLLRAKLIEYSLLPLGGLLLLSSFVLTGAWQVARTVADDRFGGGPEWVWEAGAVAIPAVLMFTTFVSLYWLLPHQPVRLRHIWPGALVAALGVEAVKQGFALYLSRVANYDLVYGSLGRVIALLFFIYVSANLLLFGAEIAAEVPHVLREEPRHGHAGSDESGWRSSLWRVLRGFVVAPGEQAGPAVPKHEQESNDRGDGGGGSEGGVAG